MREFSGVSRRGMVGLGAAAAAVTGAAAVGLTQAQGSGGTAPAPAAPPTPSAVPGAHRAPDPPRRPAQPPVRLIGDGSTADTGAQPHQPGAPERMEPGSEPPQFVIFSWDGAGELDNGLFARFRRLAADHGAKMTFFLSGIYLLPESRQHLYRPPRNPVGASAIGYLTDAHVHATLEQVRLAWLEGHEIGTHFNGHFCDGTGSVGRWSSREWQSEIDQAIGFVEEWRTNTGFRDLQPLPFDYRKELIGARTPCLLGQRNLLPVASRLGWRYDASSPGGTQVWPGRTHGLWDLPLQALPFPGRGFEVLSMDYNMLANQSVRATRSDPRNYPGWERQARESYVSGFRRAYETNRAPLFIGNHFEQWNGGIYMNAVEDALKRIADHDDVRLVSFRQFVDWLDAQDPAVLAKLRTLAAGQAPGEGWARFLRPAPKRSRRPYLGHSSL
jgi:hypothetical protein